MRLTVGITLALLAHGKEHDTLGDPKSLEEIGKLVQEYWTISAPMGAARRVDTQAQPEVLCSTLQITDRLNKSTGVLLRITYALTAVQVFLLLFNTP